MDKKTRIKAYKALFNTKPQAEVGASYFQCAWVVDGEVFLMENAAQRASVIASACGHKGKIETVGIREALEYFGVDPDKVSISRDPQKGCRFSGGKLFNPKCV